MPPRGQGKQRQGQGDQCPFCQLISNPSQLKVVGETENFYAWLDINPRAKGYTMVVPKEHKDSIEDFTASEYQEAMKMTRKVVDKAKKGLDADGVSVTMNIDEAAGQMVPHAYIQVFPRFEDDENSGTPTGAIFQPDEEAKKNLDSIKEKMAAVDSDFGETTTEPHPDSQKFKGETPERSGEASEDEGSGGSDDSGKDEAIDKLADQLEGEGGGPLSLGAGGSSSQDSEKEKRKETSLGKESGGEEENDDEEDEVRLDEDFEAKSFEWH
ncbi:MAG: HIT family protein [Candidatus Nanosalina sp.]